MAPSALPLTPPGDVQQTAELTATAVAKKIAETVFVDAGATALRPLDASLLTFTRTTTPMAVPHPDEPAPKITQCSDHMVTAEWNDETGWDAPELRPYGNLSIAPTASVLHYATECFEGMKLYRGYDGKLRLFRPDANCRRMLTSSTRIALPAFDPKELEKLVTALVAVDGEKWLPKSRPGNFLYLRPTMIGTAPAIGVAAPFAATLFILLSQMAPIEAPGGMRLLASQNSVRAWPGGFGFAKVGANYGPTLMANSEAKARGYHQVLWLLDGAVTEAGASNFLVVWRTREGSLQLITAPLDNKIILDGVNRRSILQLTRERLARENGGLEPVEIVERSYTMDEIVEATDEGRLVEAFVCGTAYFICAVSAISYRDRDIPVPLVDGESGAYAKQLKTWLSDIMYGRESHEWGVVVEEA